MIELEWERSGVRSTPTPPSRTASPCGACTSGTAATARTTLKSSQPDDPNNPTIIVHPTAFRPRSTRPSAGWRSATPRRSATATSCRRPARRTRTPGWYESTDHRGRRHHAAVHTARQYARPSDGCRRFLQHYGGNIPESLNGCDDSTAVPDETVDAPCLSNFGEDWWAQPLLNQDYVFFVPAPPKPSTGSVLVWESVDRCGDVPHSPGNRPATTSRTCPKPMMAPRTSAPRHATSPTRSCRPRRTASRASSSPSRHRRVTPLTRRTTTWPSPGPTRWRGTRRRSIAHGRSTSRSGTFGCSTTPRSRATTASVISLVANQRWQHPVEGSGDDGDPFWENGALDDGCDDDDACTYSTGVSFSGIGIVPNEALNVKMHGWDDDTTFIQDNDVNEVLPVVNVFHPLSQLPAASSRAARTWLQLRPTVRTPSATRSLRPRRHRRRQAR